MAVEIIYDSIPKNTHKRFQNLLGKTFGQWTVIEYIGKTQNGTSRWNCHCGACGSIKPVDTASLNRGNSTHCGCEQKERFVKRSTKHGMFGTEEYNIWSKMIYRCFNANCHNYNRYGGRGISVCESWRSSFDNFYKDMGPRPDGKTLDRIDNNGNYEPGNCRWATNSEQANNRVTNTTVIFNGEELTARQISNITGFPYKQLSSRIWRGLSIEEALSRKLRSDCKLET